MTKKEEVTYTPHQEDAGQGDEDSLEDFSPPAGEENKLKKLKKKLKDCQKEKGEYLTGWQRAQADLVNYRRRQEEMTAEFRKYSQEGMIKEILPVLDSLRIAKLKPIKKQLESILEKYNLKEIKAKGEKFNPEFHEAVEMAESDRESGIITEEIQKGYMLGDKVLRASKVKVNK